MRQIRQGNEFCTAVFIDAGMTLADRFMHLVTLAFYLSSRCRVVIVCVTLKKPVKLIWSGWCVKFDIHIIEENVTASPLCGIAKASSSRAIPLFYWISKAARIYQNWLLTRKFYVVDCPERRRHLVGLDERNSSFSNRIAKA